MKRLKNINWYKILNKVLHIVTFGLAKLQTIVEEKAKTFENFQKAKEKF